MNKQLGTVPNCLSKINKGGKRWEEVVEAQDVAEEDLAEADHQEGSPVEADHQVDLAEVFQEEDLVIDLGPGMPPRHHWSPGIWGPRRYGGGCFSGIFTMIIIFMLLVFSGFFNGCSMLTGCVGNNQYQSVQNSTKEREPLRGVVTKTDWYEDNIGWISSEKVLISGLEDFYKETGIQPYVLFVAYSSDLWNGNYLNITKANEYLESVYEERFEDEGHFIFAYFQCANDSKQEMEGEFRYLSGYSADTIMDSEAIDILWGYFEANQIHLLKPQIILCRHQMMDRMCQWYYQ